MAKRAIASPYPDNASNSHWSQVEPLITPQKLRSGFLFGIPLVSAIVDPFTGLPQRLEDDAVKDIIDRSISIVEAETQLDIFPVQRKEKYEFDRNEFQRFGYLMLRHKPVYSLEKLTITPSNDVDIYEIAMEWLETANLTKGQINIIPMGSSISYGSVPASTNNSGAAFLAIIGQQHWIPAYWQAIYTSGFPDGMLPRIVNELIGVQAAIEILELLAATNAQTTSQSLSIDGLSQSIGTPGSQMYEVRVQSLKEKKRWIVKKLKSIYGMTLFSSHT